MCVPLPATIRGTSILCNGERGRGTRASSIRVPCGSRSDIYSSPTSLRAKRCQRCLWVWGGISPRPQGIPAAKAGRVGAEGRQELAGSQGRAVGAVLPPYSIPDAGPVVPATSSSKSRAGTRRRFFASHGPGGADSIRLRCRRAGEGPRGLPAATAAALRSPHVPRELPALPPQHQSPAIARQPPKAAVPLMGTAENRRVQLPQVTDQQITLTHRDLIFFFFFPSK